MNFQDRTQREEIAQKHISDMWGSYRYDINQSVSKTVWYYDDNRIGINHEINVDKIPSGAYKNALVSGMPEYDSFDTEVFILNLDCIEAVFKCCDNQKFILHDFASYTNPGGGFLNGSIAQEEAICHASTLMNCLGSMIKVYDIQRANKNNSLYRNSMLYIPEVVFTHKNEIKRGDVVVCAAPNTRAALKNAMETSTCKLAMEDRIDFMLYCIAQRYREIVKAKGSDNAPTVVLGAFGTGVFGNSVAHVANVYRNLLEEDGKYHNIFKKVVFAIPTMRKDDTTFEDFKRVYNMEGNK